MKKILLFFVVFFIVKAIAAQQIPFTKSSKIYIVRHAEKETGDDPGLTEAGKKRSGNLMRTLKDKSIKRIYVTNYRRSGMTADSLRIQIGVDTVHYAVDNTGEDLLKKIQANHDSDNAILIIGHSNTIPRLIAALGILNYPQGDIPDNKFDDLFIIIHEGNEVVRVFSETYGARSGPSASMKNN
ncbi:MAG: histidine phosphatase family protein [Ferruginibacter sp.]